LSVYLFVIIISLLIDIVYNYHGLPAMLDFLRTCH